MSFPILELADQWPGARWLDRINGDGNRGIWSITLGYSDRRRPDPGARWLAVTSVAPDLNDTDNSGVALDAMHDLLIATTPDLRPRTRNAYEGACSDFIVEHVNDRSRWGAIEWTISGRAVAAATFVFAGAWAGYAVDDDVSVRVLGIGDPAAVRLQRTNDTAQYQFDASVPVELPVTLHRSADGVWDQPGETEHPWPQHRDHDTILGSANLRFR